jgi:hypothetical protein
VTVVVQYHGIGVHISAIEIEAIIFCHLIGQILGQNLDISLKYQFCTYPLFLFDMLFMTGGGSEKTISY